MIKSSQSKMELSEVQKPQSESPPKLTWKQRMMHFFESIKPSQVGSSSQPVSPGAKDTGKQHSTSTSSDETAHPVGLVIPHITKSDVHDFSSRALAFSRERKGKTKAPVFEVGLNKEYRAEESTVGEADQTPNGDPNAVLLYCAVQSEVMDVVLCWMKDKVILQPSDRINILCQEHFTQLRINYPKKSDAGEYSCVARNPQGQCETVSRLIVDPPSSEPSLNPSSPVADSNDTEQQDTTPMVRVTRSSSLRVSDNRRSKRIKEMETVVDPLCDDESNTFQPSETNTPLQSIQKSESPKRGTSTSSSAAETPEEDNIESNSDSGSQTDIRALPECDQLLLSQQIGLKHKEHVPDESSIPKSSSRPGINETEPGVNTIKSNSIPRTSKTKSGRQLTKSTSVLEFGSQNKKGWLPTSDSKAHHSKPQTFVRLSLVRNKNRESLQNGDELVSPLERFQSQRDAESSQLRVRQGNVLSEPRPQHRNSLPIRLEDQVEATPKQGTQVSNSNEALGSNASRWSANRTPQEQNVARRKLIRDKNLKQTETKVNDPYLVTDQNHLQKCDVIPSSLPLNEKPKSPVQTPIANSSNGTSSPLLYNLSELSSSVNNYTSVLFTDANSKPVDAVLDASRAASTEEEISNSKINGSTSKTGEKNMKEIGQDSMDRRRLMTTSTNLGSRLENRDTTSSSNKNSASTSNKKSKIVVQQMADFFQKLLPKTSNPVTVKSASLNRLDNFKAPNSDTNNQVPKSATISPYQKSKESTNAPDSEIRQMRTIKKPVVAESSKLEGKDNSKLVNSVSTEDILLKLNRTVTSNQSYVNSRPPQHIQLDTPVGYVKQIIQKIERQMTPPNSPQIRSPSGINRLVPSPYSPRSTKVTLKSTSPTASGNSQSESREALAVTRNSFVELPTATESTANTPVEKNSSNMDPKAQQKNDTPKAGKPKTEKVNSSSMVSSNQLPKNHEGLKGVPITKRPTLSPSLLHIAEKRTSASTSSSSVKSETAETSHQKSLNSVITSSNSIMSNVSSQQTKPSSQLNRAEPSRSQLQSVSDRKYPSEHRPVGDKIISSGKKNDDENNVTAERSSLVDTIVSPSSPVSGSSSPKSPSIKTLVTSDSILENQAAIKTDKSVGQEVLKQPLNSTPVELLPIAKLVENYAQQTQKRCISEETRASVSMLPQVPLVVEDTDNEEERVEYPSKVKTIRGVSPWIDFQVVEPLGRGKFGHVDKCREKSSGVLFASKTFRTTRLRRHNGELMEVAVLRAVGKHPQIAYMHAVYENGMECTIVTELVSGGALFKRIQDEGTLTETITVQIIRQVLLGLRHLQTCRVIHCDLKPENLVMRKPRGYELKIIDFGLACFYDPPQAPRPPAGTLNYLAPETQNYDPQSYATDLWSVAVIAYEILSGVTPFEVPQNGDPHRQLNTHEILLNITKVQYNFDDEGIVDASKEAKDFIQRILVRDPKKRPSVYECLEHPWIAMPDTRRSKVARTVSLHRHKSYRGRKARDKLPIRASSLRKE